MSETIEFEKEYYLQNITNNHLNELFELKFITAEIQLNDLRLDGLAYDEKVKTFVIIEYKNKIDFEVLNQAETYYNLLQDNPQPFIDRFNNKFNDNLTEEDFDFEKMKVMIIGPEFSKDQIERSENPEYPFELYRATLYRCDEENGCILYRQINGDFNERLDIRLDELKITEEMLLKGKSAEMIDLYHDLKNRVLNEYDDVTIKYMVEQFSFRAGGKLICVVVFLKSSFNIFLYGENLEDADKTDDISEKSTGGSANYRLNCKAEDMDYFMNLFKQVYEQKVQ